MVRHKSIKSRPSQKTKEMYWNEVCRRTKCYTEIREYAEAIYEMAKVVAPVSFGKFVPLVLEN